MKEKEDTIVSTCRKRKKSATEVIFLVLKEYVDQLIFIGIPLLIFILQIMQVWAETKQGSFMAMFLKWCLLIVLFGRAIQKLFWRFFPNKKPVKEKKQEVKLQESITQTEVKPIPAEPLPVQTDKESTALIPKDMYIHGDVEVQCDLSIYGIVEGNVYCKGDIHLFGRVNGNLRCQNLYIDKAELEGDIQCNEMVYLSPKSIVIGNIVAWRMLHKGYMKGNAYVRESVLVEKSSYLVGDVTSMEIEVEDGASIQGRMRIEAIPYGKTTNDL